jgi:hypothetical protein
MAIPAPRVHEVLLAELRGAGMPDLSRASVDSSHLRAPADANRPFLTENEQLRRFFAPELRRRLSDLQATASVAERVRAALHETLPAGGSPMTAVTRHLAVSDRTLQ